MERLNFKKWSSKLMFLLLFWVTGVFLAVFWGIGWFFLTESLRRLLTYVPPFNRFIAPDADPHPKNGTFPPQAKVVAKVFSLLITLIWIGMTVFVFLKMNFSIMSFFIH